MLLYIARTCLRNGFDLYTKGYCIYRFIGCAHVGFYSVVSYSCSLRLLELVYFVICIKELKEININ